MDSQELLWNKFNLDVESYRHYLELIIKLNVFHYAVTGAILSFYFSNQGEALIKWSLVLPIVMSALLSVFFLISAELAKVTRKDIFDLRDRLGFSVAPEMGLLIWILRIFSIVMFLTAIAIFIMLWKVG